MSEPAQAGGLPPRPLVVGAGWAGLAAAVELVSLGAPPTVVDSAPQPGGRARATVLSVGGAPVEVDNGQHLLVGAYRQTLELVGKVAAGDAPVLRRRPMRLAGTSGLLLEPSALPAPWHLAVGLLRARGLSARERWAMVRLMVGLRLAGWRVHPGETVTGLLFRTGQPTGLVRRLWEPLCVATLNTAPEDACARTFANVLRDTLGGSRTDADFVLPHSHLSDVLPRPAERWLAERGAALHWRRAVRGLQRLPGGGWRVSTTRGDIDCDAMVLALPPSGVARLLRGVVGPGLLAALDGYGYEPIATGYLFWPADHAPPLPSWLMLDEVDSSRWHGQWLFDRGRVGPWRCAAVVVSARGRDWFDDVEQGAARLAAQVTAQMRVPAPAHARLVVEKRATFRCTPQRPLWRAAQLADEAPGIWLAGDWLWPDYPATLESAVCSGVEAARELTRAARR